MKLISRLTGGLSVGQKLASAFVVVIAMLLVAISVGVVSIGSVAGKVKNGYATALIAMRASGDAYNMHVSELQNVADGGKVMAMHRGDVATFEQDMATLSKQPLTGSERAAVAAVNSSYASWQKEDAHILNLTKNGDDGVSGEIIDGRSNAVADDLSQKLDALSTTLRKDADANKAASSSSATTEMLILSALALLAAGGLVFVLRGLIVPPLMRLVRAAEGIAEGDVDQHVDVTSNDELGRVGRAFERMSEYLTEMAGVADKLGDGDLTAEANPRSDRDVLGNACAKMTASMRKVIGEVTQSATTMSSSSQQMAATSEEAGRATGEIAHAVSDVAQGAERQMAMVEDVRASAEEVARAVSESAQNAQATAEVAHEARDAAQEGMLAADQANEAMHAVRDSSALVTTTIRELASKSQQIGEIVETITGIAEQTNLLALNAAIEAARAGEQGRGFAVVAEEVRKLAEESQHAAQEISGLIGAIQGETGKAVDVVEDGAKRTEEGTAVVEQTRQSFQRIGTAVDDMAGRIEQIAAASEQIAQNASAMQQNIVEVAAVAEESSASTEQVSASTQETSASAEEIAASAQELSSNAEALQSLVAHFQI
jgi:methyl-accepting chemotaxis protein